jgi:hypothetical protein
VIATNIPKSDQLRIIQAYITTVLKDHPELDLFIASKLNEENLFVRPITIDVYGNITQAPTLLTDLENYFLQPTNFDSLVAANFIICLIVFLICLIYLIVYFTNKLQRNGSRQ